MITRVQYLETSGDADSHERHSAYYGQFVHPALVDQIGSYFGDRIRPEQDKHLNGIPLQAWDRIANWVHSSRIAELMEERGDYLTPAGSVCILKEAARQWAERETAKI